MLSLWTGVQNLYSNFLGSARYPPIDPRGLPLSPNVEVQQVVAHVHVQGELSGTESGSYQRLS
ncbi:hypothetical protein CENSYa_1070 [Cenarchaeum symbiosum A]|uniref:Uncharacterized protein n=1 Tax=Cenarchaeum symbiosum (strain A) TaxID=414004 RepID=A0RWI3_CENSY|nr:hypothetical protein CENSYa_1070 [Cenarchaeum symbiosum A]